MNRQLAAVFTLVLLAAALQSTGCGASRAQVASSMHAGLNVTTEVADPAYEMSVASCDAAEGAIIARHEPDQGDQAAERIADARRRCDAIFTAFETARQLQAAARAAVDAYQDNEKTLAEAIAAVASLREAYGVVKALVAEYRRN